MGMTFKQGDSEEAYEDYDAYTALNRQSLLRKPFVPYVAAGVVALVVILGFTMYGTSAKDSALAEEVAVLAKHLDDIEFRLGNLEQANSGGESITTLRENHENLSRQFQALEAKLGQSLNQINGQLASLEKSQQPAAKPAATAPAKKTAKVAPAKVHVVKAGETLYQISRQYGLTVDQLKKINKMGTDVTIRPGQELKVSAP
jgi:LysM repeat protein